jgi:trimethylamine:corrinoid methyltransferase-like protein
MSTWAQCSGGEHDLPRCAWLEGGLTASYEKLVLDVEILQNMIEFLRPLPFAEDDLGFEAIKAVPTAVISSALTIRSPATRPPSTAQCFRTGRTMAAEGGGRQGRRGARDWHLAAGFAEYEEPKMDPAIAKNSMPMSAAAARRSVPTNRDLSGLQTSDQPDRLFQAGPTGGLSKGRFIALQQRNSGTHKGCSRRIGSHKAAWPAGRP